MSKPTAIITGAASGIGLACAERFAADYRLILCDLSAENLNSVVAQFREQGIEVEAIAADISRPSDIEQVVSAAAGEQLIGAVIHCAGLSPQMADTRLIYEVNLLGTERLLQAVRPHIGAGSTAVCIASLGGHIAKHKGSPAIDKVLEQPLAEDFYQRLDDFEATAGTKEAYSFSKRGVQMLVEKHAPDWGQAGARIVSISPGIIDTPMGRHELERQPVMAAMLEKSCIQRMGKASEIAEAAHFLCSGKAGFISGIDLLVDGGTTNALVRSFQRGQMEIPRAIDK